MISDEYIAGFMDGEGNFSVYRHNRKYKVKNGEVRISECTIINVRVANTYMPILEEIREKYGGHISLSDVAGKHGATKNGYNLQFRHGEMLVFLPRIIPHLVEKKERAIAVLEFLQSRHKG